MNEMIGVADLHCMTKAAIAYYNSVESMTLTTIYQARLAPLTTTATIWPIDSSAIIDKI